MKVHLKVIYSTRIRLLDEEEIYCNLNETNDKDMTSYFCETKIKETNIRQVKINYEFDFVNQTNVTVISSTPLAKMFMNNLQDIDDKYDNLQNSKIYILDHSFYNKYSKNRLNITGMMDKKSTSSLENKNID